MTSHRSSLSLLLLLCACGDNAGTSTAGMSTGETTGGTGGSAETGTPTTGSAPTGPAETTGEVSTTAPTTDAATTDAATTDAATTDAATTDAATTASATTDNTTTDDTTTDDTTGGGAAVYDPNLDGPWQVEHIEGEYKVDGVTVPMDAYYPASGPEPGPYPVVLIAHGFQLPASQYTGYAQRLATHGYVALTVDFQAGFFNPDHVAYAKQVLGGIDWVAQEPTLGPLADSDNVGLTGHSLGGKLSVLAATLDPRVKASITLDPVDGSMNCDPQKCPDVSNLLPLDIPLGFVGETLDSTGQMSCAPAADNFLTFYDDADAPALAVTVLGANHMSFLDDVASCGFTCGFCKDPTLSNAAVNSLARAFVVAFYGRHLRGTVDYEIYLTGAQAQARYVETGLAEIMAK